MFFKIFSFVLTLIWAGVSLAQSTSADDLGTTTTDDKTYICNVGVRQTNSLDSNGDLISNGGLPQSPGNYVTIVYQTIPNANTTNSGISLVSSQVYTFELAGEGTSHTTAFIDDGSTSFQKRITQIYFNFGSERYGAEYFVDLCYMGHKVSFNGGSRTSDFRITSYNLSFLDQSATGFKNYAALSGLQVRVYYNCDTQRSGDQQGSSINFSNIPNVFNEADKTYTAASWTSIAGTSATVNFLGAFPNGLSLMGPADSRDAPRACLITYAFKETTTGERAWRNRQIQFILNTEIENFGNYNF